MKTGIVRSPIDPAQILSSVTDKRAGGTVLFIGTVRNRTDNRAVKGLEYEVYREMAERQIIELEKQIKKRWPIRSVRLVHREGKLRVGDVSVVVAVSAEHRGEAFEAARYAIDQIKRSFPIWKKETCATGRTAWLKGLPIEDISRVKRRAGSCSLVQRRRIRGAARLKPLRQTLAQ